jgi:predicted ABC-type sugar transport system permease subunit
MFILTVHVYTDCRTIAMLRADLTKIPASDFDIVNSGNGDWYKVNYDIEMSFEATLSFRLVFKGTFFSAPDCCKYGTTNSLCRKGSRRMWS